MSDNEHINDDEHGMGQNPYWARKDIEARADAAYKAHQVFFDSVAHGARVELATKLAREGARFYNDLFITERQKKGRPYTEVKLNKVEFDRGQRVKLNETLLAFGFLEGEFEYRPASQSYRIFVY